MSEQPTEYKDAEKPDSSESPAEKLRRAIHEMRFGNFPRESQYGWKIIHREDEVVIEGFPQSRIQQTMQHGENCKL